MSKKNPAADQVEDDQDLAVAEPEDLTDDERQAAIESEGEAEAVSYQGTDFDAEGLVRRLNRQDIVIPSFGHGDDDVELAAFQRSFVWTRPQP